MWVPAFLPLLVLAVGAPIPPQDELWLLRRLGPCERPLSPQIQRGGEACVGLGLTVAVLLVLTGC